MTHFGKIVVAIGAALVGIGVVIWLLGKLGFRGLPGDLTFEARGAKLYVPIVTCLVLSIVLSAIVWLVRWLAQRP